MLRMFFKRNAVDAVLNGFAVDRSKSSLICEKMWVRQQVQDYGPAVLVYFGVKTYVLNLYEYKRFVSQFQVIL